MNVPVRNSMLPPEGASLSVKFITPAIASEPYCADAPSRSTSAWRTAIAGIDEMSGPWAPSANPPPIQVITAARWRRLPLTSTSVWSGASPRRLAGRMIRAASPTACGLTLKEGMTVRSRSFRSVSPWSMKSCEAMASIGTADCVTVRGRARLPTATSPSSATAVSRSARSSCKVWPSASVTSRTSVAKPILLNSTVCVPAGMSEIA